MDTEAKIPEPILFNSLKHYLPYIKELISLNTSSDNSPARKELTRQLKHIGNCVMDVYTGKMLQPAIFREISGFLKASGLISRSGYRDWIGPGFNDFRIVPLSDTSEWTLKYHNNQTRYVHIFPARSSPHTFRIKANTLKSAILYLVMIGKDYITEDDLNKARALAGLSPVREVADTEAVIEMIEILRK